MADEILVMRDGEVVERGEAQALFMAPRSDYTKRLLGAIPRGIERRVEFSRGGSDG